jgi:hypothetical protein
MSSPASRALRRLWLLAALALALPAAAQTDNQESTETLSEESEETPAEESEQADPEENETAETPIPVRVMAERGVIDRSVRSRIERGDYRFCSDERYRMRRGDRDLCTLAEAAAQRCPEFRAACERPDDGRPADQSKRVERKEDPEDRSFKLPKAMSGLARAIFWILIAIGIVALVIAIAKNALPSKRDQPSEPSDDEPRAPEKAPPLVRGPIETDAERLLARAKAKAARGDYAGALADLHAALLRHLDQKGLIALHSASTNGEYVRSLREHPHLQSTLRDTVREVERVQFGAATPGDEVFQRLLRSVVPVVSRVTMVLLLAGAFLPALTGCELLEEAGDAAEARSVWGRGPGGVSLFSETLESQGLKVRHRVRSLEKIEPEVGGIIAFDPHLDEKEWAALFSFAESGGLLVVATNSAPAAKRLSVQSVGTACDGKLTLSESYRAHELFGDAKLRTTPGAALRIENQDHWAIASCGDAPYVAGGRIGDGAFVVLPNADLLTNAALVVDENAYFWAGLLGHARVVELVGPWTGGGASSPFQAVANTKLTPVLIQILLLLAVLYVSRGAHFGSPRDPPQQSRRVFAEHVRALGIVYAKAKASRLVLAAYAGWVIDRLRERLQPGTDGTLHALAHAVAQRTGRPEGDVMRILVEARTARDAMGRADSSPEDLAVMRELEQLLLETGKTR